VPAVDTDDEDEPNYTAPVNLSRYSSIVDIGMFLFLFA